MNFTMAQVVHKSTQKHVIYIGNSCYICISKWFSPTDLSTLDIASLRIKNEARINERPGTKFKRINTSRKPQEGSFCVTMYFNG